MASQTISITRALVELKRYQSRIDKAISTGLFVAIGVGQDTNCKVYGNNSTSIEAIKTSIVGSFDQVQQLILNRQKLKRAIVLSNATTQVNVLGQQMTVAEAIEMKTQVSTLTHWVNTIRSQRTSAMLTVEQLNQRMEASIDGLLTTMYGNDKNKVSTLDLQEISAPQRRVKEAKLIDPVDTEQKINTIEELISKMDSELDFVLSETNSRTTIEVEL